MAPEVAEGLGLKEVLSWVKRQSYHGYEVETDCLLLVQAIRNKSSCLSYLGRIVEECKSLLDDLKQKNVILRFVRRSANNVSH